MSRGGTETHKHSLTPWGGRMRRCLKRPKLDKRWLNCYPIINSEPNIYGTYQQLPHSPQDLSTENAARHILLCYFTASALIIL